MNNLGVKMMMQKKVAVLYHYPCHDGVFAALAAHLYLSAKSIPSLFFPNTVYSPITINQLPLQEISHLYLLDFTGPPGFVHQVSPKLEHVVILDHHKTAIETLGDDVSSNVTKVLDVERSGATIAYDYFTQKLIEEEEESCSSREVMNDFKRMRRVFEYIEDADIWKWKLPESKAFHSGILDLGIEYDYNKNQSLFEELLSLDHESVINRGRESLCRKRKLIQEALEKSYEIVLGGEEEFGRCLAVNGDEIAELRSELGNQLAEKSKNLKLRGVGAVVYRVPELEDETKVKISLRSVGEEEDTTVVSQRFGGGGHRNASSFLLSSVEFEQWKV
ncbi:unnamed protein product [Microthlaspi erraticum]|uniref:DHHA1 domain-containing protein n=1 Tax=Microthlaspi erraticum TaxID=1685480 RepID=A0A6D2HDL3_9BRAS|nr:unnamed protein product [Microthlaspi erraticum]